MINVPCMPTHIPLDHRSIIRLNIRKHDQGSYHDHASLTFLGFTRFNAILSRRYLSRTLLITLGFMSILSIYWSVYDENSVIFMSIEAVFS